MSSDPLDGAGGDRGRLFCGVLLFVVLLMLCAAGAFGGLWWVAHRP